MAQVAAANRDQPHRQHPRLDITLLRVIGMTTIQTEAEVRAALLARDPAVKMTANLARQLLTVESVLTLDELRGAINVAGFIAVPQRRRNDHIERTDVLQLAEGTVVFTVAALYGGAALGIIVGLLRIGTDTSCILGQTQGCGAIVAMIAVGFALLVAFAVGGIFLAYGTRRLYRRLEAERYLRSTRRGAVGRAVEDGTSGYVWIGRKAI